LEKNYKDDKEEAYEPASAPSAGASVEDGWVGIWGRMKMRKEMICLIEGRYVALPSLFLYYGGSVVWRLASFSGKEAR
jgi:hypothetical protein